MARDVNSRINGPAIDAFQKLNGRLQAEVIMYMECNDTKELYSNEDVINAWLVWNGIIGYTTDIINLVLTVHKE